jgi:hypothetical protein
VAEFTGQQGLTVKGHIEGQKAAVVVNNDVSDVVNNDVSDVARRHVRDCGVMCPPLDLNVLAFHGADSPQPLSSVTR